MGLSNPALQEVDTSDFDVPGKGRGLLDVFFWRFLLKLLVRKETATRYRNSALGWVWSYVRPAAQFIIFYVVLGKFLQMDKGIDNFALYLFSGIILINFFSEGFANGTRTLVDNAHLVRKIYLPRELFPIAAVIVSFVHFLPQIGVLILVSVLLFGWIPSLLSLGAILLGLVTVVSFTLGLGMLFGSVNVPFRDAQNFVELILLFATWVSPVLYSWEMVARVAPEWLMHVYLVNPLTSAVQLFHYGFWAPSTGNAFTTFPDLMWTYSWIALAISLLVLFIGQAVFRKLEPKFAQDL